MVGELTWQKRLFGLWLPLAALAVFALFPFAWMAVTSLKTNAELYDPTAMPLVVRHPSLVHYISLLKETNFLLWTANTMFVALISTAFSLVMGIMLAYPLARMRFPGAGLLAIAVAVTYLVPQTLLFVPMADLINRLNLGNTLSAVVVRARKRNPPRWTEAIVGSHDCRTRIVGIRARNVAQSDSGKKIEDQEET